MWETKNGVRLLNYLDYRKFLKDWYEEEKSLRERFSFQTYSEMLGFENRTFIQNIIKGRKHLPKAKLKPIGKFFGFNQEEERYWILLWELEKAKNPEKKQQIWDALTDGFHCGKSVEIEAAAYDVFRHWYTFVIREMLLEMQPGKNWQEIADLIQPSVRIADIEKSAQLLLDLGFVKFEKGRWLAANSHLIADPRLKNLALRQYQKEVMELGMRAFDSIDPNDRDCSSILLGVSHEGFEKARQLIGKLRSDLVDLGEKYGAAGDVESVYQINVQAFPVTGNLKQGK